MWNNYLTRKQIYTLRLKNANRDIPINDFIDFFQEYDEILGKLLKLLKTRLKTFLI